VTSVVGHRTDCCRRRFTSDVGVTVDDNCSRRVFPGLTHNGLQAAWTCAENCLPLRWSIGAGQAMRRREFITAARRSLGRPPHAQRDGKPRTVDFLNTATATAQGPLLLCENCANSVGSRGATSHWKFAGRRGAESAPPRPLPSLSPMKAGHKSRQRSGGIGIR
jgi:hypothetical protein